MNSKIKGLIIITVNLGILIGIAGIWLQSIKEERNQKSNGLKIHIVKESDDSELLETRDIANWIYEFYKKDFKDVPAHLLNLKKLEEYLYSKELVKKTDIYLDSKDQLHVDIYQRNPLVRVLDVRGNQYYLDEDGYKISISKNYAARLPVATGNLLPVLGYKLSRHEAVMYHGLIQIAKAIKKDTFANALVEQIDVDDNGEYTLIPKIGDEQIFLGGSDIIEDKLDRLRLFYKENLGRQGWNYYKQINLKFKGQVIGKKIQQES